MRDACLEGTLCRTKQLRGRTECSCESVQHNILFRVQKDAQRCGGFDMGGGAMESMVSVGIK